jgi:uncharacterized membrane protein YidH (DUF202 family)
MRTILSKERTLLAEQRTQLSIVGIGLGLFAMEFTLLRLLETEETTFRLVEGIFIFGGAILASVAILQYYTIGRELYQIERIGAKLALDYHTSTMRLHAEKVHEKK